MKPLQQLVDEALAAEIAPLNAEIARLGALLKPSTGIEGFGSSVTGGTGFPEVHVNNLNDAGSGSLRAAVSGGNRIIKFDVSGEIRSSSFLVQRGANITYDFLSAPPPGITLTGWGFDWHVQRGVKNILCRGARIRDLVPGEANGADGFQIVGVDGFVIDHCSISGWGDGSMDIAGDDPVPGVPSKNGTVQYCIFGKGKDAEDKSLLLGYGAKRVSIHHNLMFGSNDRSPCISWIPGSPETPDEIVADVWNNLILKYGWTGTSVRANARANVLNNVFFSLSSPGAREALYVVEGGRCYAKGNLSLAGLNIDAMGNEATEFPATPRSLTDALTAARRVVSEAGARGLNFGLDSVDQALISQVSL